MIWQPLRRKEQEPADSNAGHYASTPWRLTWIKFREHTVARLSLVLLAFFYLGALFCEFLAPQDPWRRDVRHRYAPPQKISIVHEGRLHRPFVYPLTQHIDPETRRITYTVDRTRPMVLKVFVKGEPYKLWGLFPASMHLLGLDEGKLYLLGADRMGRDLLSRIVYGSRISLSIGMAGVFLSLVVGVIVGGISGYYGGVIDSMIQRLIEVLRSFPTIPLWLALSAAIPMTMSDVAVYFCMTLIIALIGWTGLARVVRGRFLALREEDFVLSAKVAGLRQMQIIRRHLVPAITSHLIVHATLAVPGMILAETSLSFLRLGLRPPTISWGVLLQDAQNLTTITLHPWLLYPAAFVVVTVLAFNFVGDGLRDAVDPYKR